MFLKTARDGLSCAYGLGGTSTPLCIYGFGICIPLKKIPLQKSSALNFANLTLHAREARGVPANHWFFIAAAMENQSETDLVSSLVSIYNAARTYFSTNTD